MKAILKNPKHTIVLFLGAVFLAVGITYQNCGSVNEDITEADPTNNNIDSDATIALGCTSFTQEAYLKASNPDNYDQ